MQPIEIIVENACALHAGNAAIAANLDADVHTGFDDDTKTAPAVICNTESCSEEVQETGVYRLKVQITVKEIAADTTNTKKGVLANTIFKAFLNDNTISDLINTVSGLLIYGIIVEGRPKSEEGDAWVQTLSLDIIATLTN